MTSGARDRGAVLVIVALSLGFLIAVTSITVDIGRLSLRRRDMQAIADMVALDMARLLNGRTTSEILSSSDPNWLAELDLSAQRNGFSASGLSYRLGDMVDSTFVESSDLAHRPTAVEVTARDSIDYFFAPGGGSVTRSAVGTLGASACFTVGSFAAAVNANPTSLLPTLLNIALNSNVVSYGGLAGAQVTLGDIAANMGFGSPRELLNATVRQQDFYFATASALNQAGDTASAAVLETIAAQTSASATFNVIDIIRVQEGAGEQAALSTAFNVLDLVAGSAFLVNGNRVLTIPDLAMSVPGLSSASADVTIIENPQIGCTGIDRPGVTTSQVSVTINMTIDVPPFAAQVAVTTNMAAAEGTLVSPLSCGSPTLVNVNVSESLATTSITQTILGATTAVNRASQGTGGGTVGFTLPPDAFGQIKRTGSGSVALGGTDVTTLAPGVQLTMNVALPLVDSLLVSPLLSDYAGLTVAGADVAALSASCNDVLLAH